MTTARKLDEDPVLRALRNAPLSDVPLTEEEVRSLDEAQRSAKKAVPHAKVAAELEARRAK